MSHDFGEIGQLDDICIIQDRINNSFDKLYFTKRDGTRCPYVCSFCDEFIINLEELHWYNFDKFNKVVHLLKWSSLKDSDRIAAMEEHFKFNDSHNEVPDKALIDGVALSPRGIIGKTSDWHRAKKGFSCCKFCNNALDAQYTPLYSIVNKNYIGGAPKCLTDLTEVELALVTPVQSYGYCLTFVGGMQRQLKGTMTFMRVQERSIARASAHLEGMGLLNHVVILMSGYMTEAQQKKVKKKKEIRTDKMIAAVEWLSKNNALFKDVDLDKYRQDLQNAVPIFVDQSKKCGSQDSNVEEKELFSCYFPDGYTNEQSGGFDSKSEFLQYVEDLQKKKFDLNLKLDLEKEFFQKHDGDLYTKACLLQFPYGIGGTHEKRRIKDGAFTDNLQYKGSFLKHLSKLSDPIFQTPMFLLILYSQITTHRLLKRSNLQVRGEHNVKQLVHGLNYTDLQATIRGRRAGNYNAGTSSSKALLNSVQACSRAVPHTNEASKAARGNGEAMQHHFGIGSLFLTVTFDDETSMLMIIMSNKEFELDVDYTEMTNQELEERQAFRHDIRVSYPGLGAINFEMLLSVLTKDVIGWDITLHKMTDELGLFGACKAFSMAVEEQGRHTLHAHMTLWIKGYRELQKKMFFGTNDERMKAQGILGAYYDRLINTQLFKPCSRTLQRAFDHDCKTRRTNRILPTLATDQELRILRHKLGHDELEGALTQCPHCDRKFSIDEMVNMYCQEIGGFREPGEFNIVPELPKARMSEAIMQFQALPDAEVEDCPILAVNALHQVHSTKHRPNCFKCHKLSRPKKRKHKCNKNCECRYRMPDRPRRDSLVQEISTGLLWYQYDGDTKEQPLIEFLPKRRKYDVCQNVSCKAISESKFSCNSNVSLITDGPVGQYQFKYQHKGTQADDTAEFAAVAESIKKMTNRVHDDDRREAKRRICRAAFTHNKDNVTGGSMAAYLTRHASRFYFSHEFVFCPINDLIKVVNEEKVSMQTRFDEHGVMYFENQALHYLCRSVELEDLNVKEFFEEYEKKRVKKEPENEQYPFESDTGHFQHPSASKYQNGNWKPPIEAVEMRDPDKPVYIKVPQWAFPDTAKFSGNLLTCPQNKMCSKMNEYAQKMLTLFYPHRCRDDLMPSRGNVRYPYIFKLREVNFDERSTNVFKVFTTQNLEFLQNIQDCAYNAMRYRGLVKDDLARDTEPFSPPQTENCDDSEHEEEDEYEDTTPYEDLLDQLDDVDATDNIEALFAQSMKGFSFSGIRNIGKHGCGYDDKLPPPPDKPTQEDQESFVHMGGRSGHSNSQNVPPHQERPKYTRKKLVEVLYTRTTARTRDNVFKNKEAKVPEANGSLHSIFEWAKAANLDRIQKRAFECILSAFLLTFFELDPEKERELEFQTTNRERLKFARAKARLLRLKGHRPGLDEDDIQLICLLHGPGGSGKSTVINLVTAYAREYCDLIGHTFTSRTIVVTAMSGVAATLLHGETTHSALHLRKRRALNQDHLDEWGADARLIIIDEISFASEADFRKMSKNLKYLMQKPLKEYGGVSIVFAGDFSQLEPVGRGAIYKDDKTCPEFHNSLDTFIELNGQHRFRDDPEWGEMLYRFRLGEPTKEDIDNINENCLITDERIAPEEIQIATYYNSNRDAINSSIFEDYCFLHGVHDGSTVFEGAVMVLMDSLTMQDGKKKHVAVTSNSMKRHFYANCGESACKVDEGQTGRCDPVLKLYPKCPVMLTQNKDVLCGQANGSRLFLTGINVKQGESPLLITLNSGVVVRAFYASQVSSLSLRHEEEDMIPRDIELQTEKFNFSCDIPIEEEKLAVSMSGKQFPIVSNSATTGHKLQGYTAQSLLVNDWRYKANWAYVVLSRVTTMAGMYIKSKLSTKLEKYKKPPEMKRMLRDFQTRLGIELFSSDIYDALLNEELADS